MFVRQPAISIAPPNVIVWRQTVQGDPLAVDVDEVKTHVNRPLADTFWDAEYERFIKIAVAEIERECRIDLTAKTWVGTLPRFWDRISVAKRPFLSVDNLSYVSAASGEILPVPAGVFHALPVNQMTGMVFLGDGMQWPAAANRWDAVRMTLRSGFGISADEITAGYPPLPDVIRHALLMTVAAIDSKRGDDAGGSGSNVTVYAMKTARGGTMIPPEARSLIADYKLRWVTV